MSNRLASRCMAMIATAAASACLAVPAAADSPLNSAQGSVIGSETGIRGDLVDNIRVTFSARSDASFQATQGVSGSAGGMLNVTADSQTNPLVPELGRVEISCLNVHDNVAVMTGTVSHPISTNDFTGAPWYRPANWWIVGAYLEVIDNGDAPPQLYWGFFVNPEKDHVVSTPRCFGGGLVPATLLPADQGHANVHDATF